MRSAIWQATEGKDLPADPYLLRRFQRSPVPQAEPGRGLRVGPVSSP